jgi:hypothetical protein
MADLHYARTLVPGGSNHPLYGVWINMLARCQREGDPSYKDYGARGIRVCDRWMTFELFTLDMGERPPGTSMERLDNNAGYCPENVTWATPLDQGNNKRNTLWMVVDGVSMSAKNMHRKYGVPYKSILCRAKEGWTGDQIVQRYKGQKFPNRVRWTKARAASSHS